MANLWKNTANQKIAVRAWDKSTGAAKTGDAANITAQISKDGGTAAATNDVNPTEVDATDHPGLYVFDMTQAETNADLVSLTAKSSTSDVVLDPIDFHTLPANLKLMYENAIVLGSISDAGPTTTDFDTGLSETTDDHYNNLYLVFITGPNAGLSRKISDYDGTSKNITLAVATVETPTNGDLFMILGRSE